jgi:CelD/BcsL family acetyltransferase involved in cellulose biosynthesis
MIQLAVDEERWLAFVRTRSEATAFHHPAWALLLAECYSMPGLVLALADDRGGLRAGVPVLRAPRLARRARRWVSLPFTDALPPLVESADAGLLATALEAWRQASDVERIELRAALPGARQAVTAVTHLLPLDDDLDRVERGYAPAVRRNIRAAGREGLVVRTIDSEHALADEYYRLHIDTRRRLGVPPQPRRFFQLLWRRMLDGGLGFALLVYKGSTPIAGAVFLSWNGTVTYKYGASDRSTWHLRPNNPLFAEAIRRACEEGNTQFDFGRSDLSADGLRRFKRGWGAVESPLTYCAFGGGMPGEGEWHSKLVGEVLRRSPLWAGRAVGELLYRYAA